MNAEKEVEMNAEKEVEMIKFEDFKVENEKSDDEDESGKGDNEDGQNEMEKIHVKIQSKASKKAELKEKKGSKKSSSDEAKGDVVYLGRIPHGFYEEEMKAYFSQFGEILNLRLSRNKKTGASKHYAFIKFANPAVAEIVVETMHNYLLSNRLLQCKNFCLIRL
jgi:nucleolar protein 15